MFDRNRLGVIYERGARDNQEDSYVFARLRSSDAPDLPDCIIVADGMGGHENGELAAHLTVKSFLSSLSDNLYDPAGKALFNALSHANDQLYLAKREHGLDPDMGCTLVGAHIRNSRLRWISVGDSPLFLFRKGKLSRLNEDHSEAGRLATLVRKGMISQEDADARGGKNILRSAVAGGDIDLVDNRFSEDGIVLEDDDLVIVATDGIDTLAYEDVASIIANARGDVDDITQHLETAIKDIGHPRQDNYTIVVYRHTGRDNSLESFLLSPQETSVSDMAQGEWDAPETGFKHRLSDFLKRD
ncbi:MAG: protein phosphatase 2C domain-containing protein [Pseudomonadota bacterium]